MNNTSDLYEVQWNNHTKILKTTFELFRSDNELVDVTLSCEGNKLKAHKIVLSACSTYFLDLFRDNPCQHPIIIMRDVKYQNMVDILNFMYLGEANVAIEYLNSFLQTAELLQVKGLADTNNPAKSNNQESNILKNTEINQDKQSAQMHTNASETVSSNLQASHASTNIELNSVNASNDIAQNLNSPILFKTESTEDVSDSESVEYFEDKFNITPFENKTIDESVDGSLMESINILGDIASNPETNQDAMLKKCYSCPHCSKVFSHSISLKLHLPTHSGRTSCTLCNAVLSRKYYLKLHMRRKHKIELK